jgi:hypothetical protein
MAKSRSSFAYHRFKLDLIDVFAIGVRDGIYNNPTAFSSPPLLPAVFQGLIDGYVSTRGAYKMGGMAQKPAFLQAKIDLMRALDATAEYVDGVANGNELIIILAGYTPTKTTQSNAPAPVQPTGVRLTRSNTGILLAECDNQPVADTYLAFLTPNAPIPAGITVSGTGQIVVPSGGPGAQGATAFGALGAVEFIIDINKNRKKKFMALTPGVTYFVTFVAINAQGVSPFSDSASCMCA